MYVLITRQLVVWDLSLHLVPEALTTIIIFFFSFPAVSVSLFPRYHALQFFLSPDCCFHFCEEDTISTGINLWIHREGKGSRKRSLLWEVGREDSVSLVFVMLLMSDILTGNSFKALLYRFQTPPLLYVTEGVFMWSLLLATLGLHSDLHKYMADGEDRPLSHSLSVSTSVCVSHARVGLAVPVWRVWGDCSYSQSVCFCQTHCPSPSLQVEWKVCVRVWMRGSFSEIVAAL